jgi:hypothetical protein
MRLCWVLLLVILIVSGTARGGKPPKDDDGDDKDNGGDDNGDVNHGRYLDLYLLYKQIGLNKGMLRRSPFCSNVGHKNTSLSLPFILQFSKTKVFQRFMEIIH